MALEALRQQKDSLESLNLQGLRAHLVGISLGTFSRLKTLEVGFDLLFGWLLQGQDSNYVVEGPEVDFELESLFPPSIQQLTLRYCMINNPVAVHRLEALASFVEEKLTMLPNLRHLLLTEEKLENESLTISQESQDVVQRRLLDILHSLKSNGVDGKHEVKGGSEG